MKFCAGQDIINAIASYQSLPQEEIENTIKQIIQENPEARFNALMGEAMKQLKGKADGKTIAEVIKRLSG